MADKDEYLDAEDRMTEIRERYTAAKSHARIWRTDARKDFDFYAGNQWDEDDKQKLVEQQRVPVTFNRVGILIDAVIGYEVNNRQETRYIPRTQGDAKVNELLTEGANYFRDQCDAEFEESDAFRDMCICGMGWTNDRLSDERNPQYDLVRDRVDPLRMLWDPSARKPNLDDARYVIFETSLDKAEAKALVPQWSGEYVAAEWLDEDDTPGQGNPRMTYRGSSTDQTSDRDVKVLEYQYCEDKIEHIINNPMSGQQAVMSDDKWEDVSDEDKKLFEGFHSTQRKRVWKRCICIGGEHFEIKHPYPGGPTFHCVTGKRDRNSGHWFGLMRGLRDPQMWSNKWLSQIMHLINTSAKPGYDVEKGAIDNVAEFEAKAAKPGAINVFRDGAVQKGAVQRREAASLPPDLANLMSYANDAMSDVSGVNQELLGMADREQAGVLEYQRKQSAVTLLAPLFDSFRRYRKISGRCWLHFMQNYMTDGRLIRITKDDGSQAHVQFQQGEVPNPSAGQTNQEGQPEPEYLQFFDPNVAEYDVIVDQSSSSPNLKEATWAAMQPMLPIIQERGGPEEFMLALEYSPIPESFVEKLKQINDKRAQQPPSPDPEMEKMKMQMQMKQAELQMKGQDAERQAQLEMQKAQMQLQIEAKKAEQEMALSAAKAQQEMQLAEQKMRHQLQLEAMKVDAQMRVQAQSAEIQGAVAMQQMTMDNERADYKTAADVSRMDKIAKARAKAKPKVDA
jgi:hypothetical protein